MTIQFYSPSLKPKSEEKPAPSLFGYFSGVYKDIVTTTKIALTVGTALYNGQMAEPVDHEPESPHFVLIKPEKASTTTAILYAPGYLDDPQTLRETCGRIAEAKKAPVYIVGYYSKFQSIEKHAQDIARVVQRIFRDLPASDLVLIGHSMGGLTTGTYLLKSPYQDRCKFWVTIASPLKGTSLAYLGYGECAKQMRPSADFIQKFQSEVQKLSHIPSLHIYTTSDLIVPSESAHLGENKIHLPAEGHLSVRSCPEVEAAVIKAIPSFYSLD